MSEEPKKPNSKKTKSDPYKPKRLPTIEEMLAAFKGVNVKLPDLLVRYRIKSRQTILNWMRPKGQEGGRGFPKPAKPEGSRATNRWRVADVLRWETEEGI